MPRIIRFYELGGPEVLRIENSGTPAAGRAKAAGFDAVEIHCAHGFLLSEFLSPAFNKRTDEYGGSLENRVRLPLEVMRSVRETVGPKYPVLGRINSEDFSGERTYAGRGRSCRGHVRKSLRRCD